MAYIANKVIFDKKIELDKGVDSLTEVYNHLEKHFSKGVVDIAGLYFLDAFYNLVKDTSFKGTLAANNAGSDLEVKINLKGVLKDDGVVDLTFYKDSMCGESYQTIDFLVSKEETYTRDIRLEQCDDEKPDVLYDEGGLNSVFVDDYIDVLLLKLRRLEDKF